jgi:uncharacterized repeat protein (TIGR01451 family)
MQSIGILPARNRKRAWRLAAAAWAMAALHALSAQAQCPAPGAPVQIEVLPFTDTRSACNFTVNTVNEYAGACTSPRTPYSQPEAIYKVSLHPGNKDVEFRVTSSSADLVLALLSACGDGTTCVKSSSDIPHPGAEVIPKPTRPYLPGIYFLNVDSKSDKVCGYTLTVTGVNPVPDLKVGLTSSPKPVMAGQPLTYTLSVENEGDLPATDVTVIQTLPIEVSVPTIPGCTVLGRPMTAKKVVCPNIDLTVTPHFTKVFKVTVAASTPSGFTLSSTATASAKEGGQVLGDKNPANNQTRDNATVKGTEALGSEPPLLVPYFEIGPAAGATTLLTVRNEAEDSVKVRYEYFSDDGKLRHAETLPLAARATRTVDLHGVKELQGLTRGYVQISSIESPMQEERILSGDFVRLDPARGLALGGALVDTDPQRSPRQLCRRWNVRFLQGDPPGSTTSFVFYVHHNSTGSPGTATGQVYGEAGGNPVRSVQTPINLTAFQVEGSSLGLTGKGSIEWDLGDGVEGNVAGVLRTGGLSVLVPGVCSPGSQPGGGDSADGGVSAGGFGRGRGATGGFPMPGGGGGG